MGQLITATTVAGQYTACDQYADALGDRLQNSAVAYFGGAHLAAHG